MSALEPSLNRTRRVRRSRTIPSFNFVLLLASLFIVARALADVTEGLDPMLLTMVALGGATAGWLLALSRLGAGAGALFSLALGAIAMLFLAGRIEGEFVASVRSLSEMREPLWRFVLEDEPLDWSEVVASTEALRDAIGVLTVRGTGWIASWITGSPTFDPVAAALVWSLLLWAIASWAGWFVRRHNHAILALLPAGVLMIGTLGYLGSSTGPVIGLLGLLLILLALGSHDALEREWSRRNVRYGQGLWRGVAVWAALISLALVTVGAGAENLSVENLIRPNRILTEEEGALRDQITDALGLRDQRFERRPVGVDRLRAPGLPRSHLIGSGPELSDAIVMFVKDLTSDPSESIPTRFYVRSNTYDVYTGRGWQTSNTESRGYLGGDSVRSGVAENHHIAAHEYHLVGEILPSLYVTGDLVTADQDFRVEWRSEEDDFGALFEAMPSQYRAESLVLEASEEDLRSAGQEYPNWVRASYLDLPASMPDRVLTLAQGLTATEPTPYDRAQALETYLRAFPYTLNVVPPPPGRDVADFFLFDLQKGYCDYYATSMVVLARAAGLPARVVVGYIADAYSPRIEAHIITEAEAHSWVEIYFPEYGWVEFEPTGGRPVVHGRGSDGGVPSSTSPARLDPGELGAPSGAAELTTPQVGLPSIGWVALAVPAGLVVVALGLWDTLRLWRRSAKYTALTLFQDMKRHAGQLSIPVENGHTPSEFAELLKDAVRADIRSARWNSLLGAGVTEVELLTRSYETASYEHDPGKLPEKARLIQGWRMLKRRLWIMRLREKIGA